MTDEMTIDEINQKIGELKAQIEELKRIKADKQSGPGSLYQEGQIFINGGHKASEELKLRNIDKFLQKCVESGFENVEWHKKFGLNKYYHRSKWENAKIKACVHASNGRAKYPSHLTHDELKYAKIYALAYAKEWIEFWEGDIRDESWKTD